VRGAHHHGEEEEHSQIIIHSNFSLASGVFLCFFEFATT
jgi:hypothetical protein